jgi:hypothetical protein
MRSLLLCITHWSRCQFVVAKVVTLPKVRNIYIYIFFCFCIWSYFRHIEKCKGKSVPQLDDRGSRVRFPAGLGIFLFTTASRTALEPTQPPIQWVPGALSVKRPGHGADHLPPSSAEVKNAWSNTSTPAIHLHGVVLS